MSAAPVPLADYPGARDPSLLPPPPYGSRAAAAAPAAAPAAAKGAKQPVAIPLYLKLITGGVAGVIGTTIILCVRGRVLRPGRLHLSLLPLRRCRPPPLLSPLCPPRAALLTAAPPTPTRTHPPLAARSTW